MPAYTYTQTDGVYAPTQLLTLSPGGMWVIMKFLKT